MPRRFLLVFLLVATAMLLMVFAAAALDVTQKPRPWSGLVCDTPAQVEHYISLVEPRDPFAALDKVNAEAGYSTACVIATFVFRQAKVVVHTANRHGEWQVVEVELLAVLDGTGRLRRPPPGKPTYFIILPEDQKA